MKITVALNSIVLKICHYSISSAVVTEEDIYRKIASGVDQDQGCSKYEWWCRYQMNVSTCIPVNEPCNEKCHYNPSYDENLEDFTQVNVPAYCKDTKKVHTTDGHLQSSFICAQRMLDFQGCLYQQAV